MVDVDSPAGDLGTAPALRDYSCFDPGLAAYPTRTLPVDQVVDLLYVSHLPERIERYREAMRQGDRFPPISVVEIAGRFFVADGHKRFTAYKGLPVNEVVVEVWTTRRWLADQWQQLAGKTRQHWVVLTRSAVDHRARAQAVRLFRDTLGHWRRIALSVAGRLARSRRHARRRRSARHRRPADRREGASGPCTAVRNGLRVETWQCDRQPSRAHAKRMRMWNDRRRGGPRSHRRRGRLSRGILLRSPGAVRTVALGLQTGSRCEKRRQ